MNAVKWTRKSGEEAAGRALHAGGAADPELALPPQAHNAITGRITINAAQRFTLDLSKFTLSARDIINTTGFVMSDTKTMAPSIHRAMIGSIEERRGQRGQATGVGR
ncbi:MAG: hypothetical protein WAU33_05250 [Candidatus Binataceae bacterium]